MKKTLNIFYNILYIGSIIFVFIGFVFLFLDPNSNYTIFMSTHLARYGVYLLVFLLASKSLFFILKNKHNKLTEFLKVNNMFQRKSGIVVFILFLGHTIIELIKYFGVFSFWSYTFSVIIPIIILAYMMITSYTFFQKKNRKWKRNHSIIWLAFPLIVIHIFLLSTLGYIYIILILIIGIIILLEILFYQNRGIKHIALYASGAILAILTLLGFNFINNLNAPEVSTPIEPATNNQSGTPATTSSGIYRIRKRL